MRSSPYPTYGKSQKIGFEYSFVDADEVVIQSIEIEGPNPTDEDASIRRIAYDRWGNPASDITQDGRTFHSDNVHSAFYVSSSDSLGNPLRVISMPGGGDVNYKYNFRSQVTSMETALDSSTRVSDWDR